MRDRFRNEFGAHVDYSKGELSDALTRVFTTAINISPKYNYGVCCNKKLLVSALLRTGASRWLFPAVYFYGIR